MVEATSTQWGRVKHQYWVEHQLIYAARTGIDLWTQHLSIEDDDRTDRRKFGRTHTYRSKKQECIFEPPRSSPDSQGRWPETRRLEEERTVSTSSLLMSPTLSRYCRGRVIHGYLLCHHWRPLRRALLTAAENSTATPSNFESSPCVGTAPHHRSKEKIAGALWGSHGYNLGLTWRGRGMGSAPNLIGLRQLRAGCRIISRGLYL